MRNEFRFIGEVLVAKDKEALTDVIPKNKESKWRGKKMKFGIKNEQGKAEWCEIFGGNNPIIKTKNIDNENVDIPFEERKDESVLKLVAGYKKLRIADGQDIKEFISEYDFATEVNNLVGELKDGERLEVAGEVSVDFYEGKTYKKYNPTFVRVITDGDIKSKLTANLELYYTSDAVDNAMEEEDRKVFITSYIKAWHRTEKKNYLIPNNVVINCSAIDKIEDEDNKKRFINIAKFKARQFEVTDGWYKCGWETTIFKGSEDEAFTEDDLTEFQKEQIEFGMQTLEEIAKSHSIRGVDKVEQRVTRIAGTYVEEGKEEVLEEVEIYTGASEVSVKVETKKESAVADDDFEDLFD